jgi:hypothetical protein
LFIDQVLLAAVFAALVLFVFYLGLARCPVCGDLLGRVAIVMGRANSTAPANCPHCHVSLDDPMPPRA